MSDFLAEARVVIRPDTTRFRAQLQEEVNRAVSQARIAPLAVPVAVTAGAGLAGVTAATAGLAAAQETATRSTLGLATAAQVENSAFGQQAVILGQATKATQLKAGADATAAAAARSHAVAQGQVQKAAFASAAGMLGLRGAVLTAGTAFLGATVAFQALGKSIALAAQFEQDLDVFQVTAGATADEMARVSEAARALGRDITLPGVSAVDAAQALQLLSRSGLDVQESLDAVRGTLQLATAAQIDNAQAAELVANALNSFNLDGADAVRVADLLAGAANESQGSILDMGIALRQAAAAANVVGISVEDTLTLLTQLAQNGLSASDAGTSLRTALIRLVADMPKVEKTVDGLGLQLRDLDGNIRPEVFGELSKELAGLTPEVQQATIAALGGSDAFRTFGLLADDSTQGFLNTKNAITEAGLAAELAGARTQGLSGDIEALKNQASEAGLSIGQLVSPFLSSLTSGSARALGGVNALAGGLRQLVSPPREAADSLSEMQQQLAQARDDLDSFKGTAIDNGAVRDLRARIDELSTSLNEMGASAAAAGRDLDGFGLVAGGVTTTIEDLISELNRLSVAGPARAGGAQGLNVQQILNRVTGFDSSETRARISADTGELLSVLQSEQDFLEQQLQRDFVQRRPGLRRQLEQALLGVTNDLVAISNTTAAEKKAAAAEVSRTQREADQALLDTLSERRDDAGRRAANAATTQGLSDDIRAQDRIQALIKIQIQKVRARVQDEQSRKNAIRELRLALIASRQEEEALRREQLAQAQTAKQTSVELDIAFAETTGNVDREVAARQRLISLLKKQQALVKKGTNEWKRLRNEIAEQQQAIKEARDQAEDTGDGGRSAQQFLFEQLQAQQGFAANLLGNLITGPTEGLVGVPAPAPSIPDLGARTGAEVGVATGRAAGGPTGGQVNTQIDVLLRILNELRRLNGSYDSPEAIHQKKVGAGNMDNFAM